MSCLPFEVDSFDDEAQCRTDSVDVLAHDFLDNCGFACVVKATSSLVPSMCLIPRVCVLTASGFASLYPSAELSLAPTTSSM